MSLEEEFMTYFPKRGGHLMPIGPQGKHQALGSGRCRSEGKARPEALLGFLWETQDGAELTG